MLADWGKKEISYFLAYFCCAFFWFNQLRLNSNFRRHAMSLRKLA